MQCCFGHKHMTNENALEAVELMLLSFPSQGECEIYMDVNIVDDDERLLTLRVNITMQVKSTGSKNAIFDSWERCRKRKSQQIEEKLTVQ